MQVLAVSRDNGKALFRRGKAHRLAGRTDSAARDLKAARVLMPKDSAVRDEIQVQDSSLKTLYHDVTVSACVAECSRGVPVIACGEALRILPAHLIFLCGCNSDTPQNDRLASQQGYGITKATPPQILRSTAAEDRKAADAMFKGVLGAQANTPAGATGAWWQRLCAWLHGLGRRLIGRLASWSSRPSSESQSKLAMEE